MSKRDLLKSMMENTTIKTDNPQENTTPAEDFLKMPIEKPKVIPKKEEQKTTTLIQKAAYFSNENALFIQKQAIVNEISISDYILSIFQEEKDNFEQRKIDVSSIDLISLMNKNSSYGKNSKRFSFFLTEEVVDFLQNYQKELGVKLTTMYNYIIDKKRKAL